VRDSGKELRRQAKNNIAIVLSSRSRRRGPGDGLQLRRRKIALEAANAVLATDHMDPGDCFLIGTARLKQIPIVTRDSVMRNIAAVDPDYLAVVVC
jgi:hypothetical protein